MTEEAAPLGCLPKISRTWRLVLGTLGGANRVYPSDPIPPKDSEFILLESKINIRFLHLTPDTVQPSLIVPQDVSSKRSSVSEDYWFMRNRPLRNTSCNCSFRRSLRKSFNTNGPINQKTTSGNFLNVSYPNGEVKKVESFVDQLIQETISEAFQECCTKNLKNGIDNKAYDISEPDGEVILRNKDLHKVSSPSNFSRNCNHKKLKPLIILFHGLGCTADIWEILMHNLSFMGFEVVAPDLLGHGYSSAPNKTSYYQFKSLLLQAIEVFDYFMKSEDKRKCILIGHSYGCSLVTALYPHRATKIAQLVLISGGGPTPLAPPTDANDISPYGWAHNLCYPFLYCGLKRTFFYSPRGKNFKFCEEESTVPPHIKQFLIQGQCWPEGDSSFHRRIIVPTLLVHGLKDKNVTLVQECEMERTIPRAFLELIPNAGHMSMVETPEQLTHMISCFVEMWT